MDRWTIVQLDRGEPMVWGIYTSYQEACNQRHAWEIATGIPHFVRMIHMPDERQDNG